MKLLIPFLFLCITQVWSQENLEPVYIYPEEDKIYFVDVYGQKKVIDEVLISSRYKPESPSGEYAYAVSVEAVKRGKSYHVSYSNYDAIYYLSSHDDGQTWQKKEVDDMNKYDLQMYDPTTGKHEGSSPGDPWMGTISVGTRLAVDAKGEPHISYTVSGGNYHYDCFAVYAYIKNGKWETQKVLTNEGYPKRYLGSIALDINKKGAPYIIVHSHEKVNTRLHSLSLFTLKGKKWKRQIISKRNTGSPSMNIRIDKEDNLHVLSTISTDSVFYWMSKDNGKTWNEQYLLKGNCRCDVELDSKNQPQMACSCYNDGVYYGIKLGNSWSIRRLETRNQMCHAGIAIDANDKSYVSFFTEYHHPADINLYTLSDKNQWELTQPIQTLGKRGSSWHPALVFDIKKEEKIDSSNIIAVDTSQISTPLLSYENRPTREQHYIETTSKEITISVIDYAREDNDSISIKVNDRWLLENHRLTKAPKEITFILKENMINSLVLYALNEGDVPPNTATLIIQYGDVTKRVKMTSDLELSGSLGIRYVKSKD
jgi:hypothetical protein